jgi:periplasmic divalent cation tolerance protein
MSSGISVYVTCKDSSEAKKIARALLENKYAACVTTFPVESFFHWGGSLREEHEVALLIKTRKELFGEVEEEIKLHHSYEVPCIVALPWDQSSEDYDAWVGEHTNA